MSGSAHHAGEQRRLQALLSLDILDTPPEQEFDEITRLAATALGVTSAGISLIDADRQWFKSRRGIGFSETPRDMAFCHHAIEAGDLLIVPDASLDPRFQANPLVICEDGIRFYAGMPLRHAGKCLGTLCVFDPSPREGLTAEQIDLLSDLARLTVDLIEARRFRRMGEIAARVVDATSDAVLAADQNGQIVQWNAAAEQMFGRPAEEALGRNVDIIMPERFARNHGEIFARAAAGGPARMVGSVLELVAVRANGEEFPVELSLAQWGGPGSGRGYAAIIRDITSRKTLEAERTHAKAFLDSIVENLPAMLFVKDRISRRYLLVNKSAEQIIGRPAGEIVGATDRELFPEYGQGYEDRDTAAAQASEAQSFESVFVREDGRPVHLRTRRAIVDGPDAPAQYILGISEDVSETRQAEAEVRRLARFDVTTGLLNRASYAERLQELVLTSTPLALLFIDLDRFKAVNDQFGHLVGDLVLSKIAQRILSTVGPDAWVARIGGDEFVAVLTGDDLRERAESVAEAIISALSEPVPTERAVAYIGASIGIVLSPENGNEAELLRHRADLAMYRAKRDGKGLAYFFDPAMDVDEISRRALERDLRTAIAAEEIELVYQPVIQAETGLVTSAEALARWTHPEHGPISPGRFVSLAEESGLIDPLGEQLLRRACREASEWPDRVCIAVNLSPLQFVSGCLPEKVQSALKESGLKPGRLQLEVTEGLVIRDVERTFSQLEELRALGIQILIDDFGVGYSSLSYFQRFSFDKVKIDKSFVDGILTSQPAKAIIQAVVGLGQNLGMGVVAEGVENEEQVRALIACGCTHLQGYYFSKPLPAAVIRSLLQAAYPDREKKTRQKA